MTKEQILLLLDKVASGNEVDGEGALKQVLTAVVNQCIPVEVTDITKLSSEQLDGLVVGAKVVKVTGKQKHTYVVSYKGEGVGEGLCLTYADAAGTETVSYDYTVDGWAYNSTDKGLFA